VTGDVTLDVWSDVLCPWCYVAAVRLVRLNDEPGAHMRLRWHSYLLQPQPRAKPLESFRRYTDRWFAPSGPASFAPDVEFRRWNDETPPSHSVPPAMAVHATAAFGDAAQTAFRLALLRAYFVDHRDVAARDVVLDVAAAVGIGAGALGERLRARGRELHDAVFADHDAGTDRYGITAVPTVVVNEALPVRGAQPVETYRRILARATERAG
jgi:predicted DsbA family dithiol-disulfide isomerase